MRIRAGLGLVVTGGLLACGAGAGGGGTAGGTAADSAGIRALATTYAEAFNKHDTSVLKPVIADDYQDVDATGMVTQGATVMLQRMDSGMKAMPMPAGMTMSATTTYIRFLSPTSAVAGGTFSLSPATPGMPSRGAWMGAAVKKDSTWQMVASLAANDDTPMMAMMDSMSKAKAKPKGH